jgi:4-hydroxybenzoate decarboxylase
MAAHVLHEDLRAFLTTLDREGQLLTVRDEVSLEPDLGAAACAVNRIGDTAPAVLFESVHGYRQQKVALNVHGSWYNHALMLGMPKDTPLRDQFYESRAASNASPLRSSDAPALRGKSTSVKAMRSICSRCCRCFA